MLLFLLIPVLTIIAGGLAAVYLKPSQAIYSIILHFSAGVVFSVVAVELLPDIIRIHDPVRISIGFSLGIIFMLTIMYFSGKMEERASVNKHSAFPVGLLLAVGIDITIDGLLLGIGFSAGRKEGILLSLALATENLTLSLATVSSLRRQGLMTRKLLLVIIALASIFLLSSMAGDTLFHNLPDTSMEIILSFGLAALLFLVTEELLVKAHEQKDNIWLTAPFFIGFLLFLILGVIM